MSKHNYKWRIIEHNTNIINQDDVVGKNFLKNYDISKAYSFLLIDGNEVKHRIVLNKFDKKLIYFYWVDRILFTGELTQKFLYFGTDTILVKIDAISDTEIRWFSKDEIPQECVGCTSVIDIT